MKEVLKFICCAAIIVSVCGCKQAKETPVSAPVSGETAAVSSEVSIEETVAESVTTETVASVETGTVSNESFTEVSNENAVLSSEIEAISSVAESVSSEEVSAPSKTATVLSEKTAVSSKNTTTSNVKKPSSKVSSTASKTESATKNSTQKPASSKVKDPYNKRGLSTKKYGFSFGVAKDGKPHSQSVINQKTFDGFKNVEALALDTKTQKKVMYLTFDNGYEYKNLTADILDTLKKKQVKAAFFVTLSYVKQNKDLVRRMIDEGHIVGNHSANHPSFPSLTRTQMAEEILELDRYLRENFSYSSPYFRFPAGEYSENCLELVTSIGYRSIFWSVAHTDWDTSAQKGAKAAYDTVTSRFHSGAVILLHAVSSDNTKALGDIIDNATRKGYTFATLDDYFVG